MRLPFLRDAAEELEHLEAARQGWGERLLHEVARYVELAADHPEIGQRVSDTDGAFDVRRFVIPKFGCSVVVALYEGDAR